MTAGRAGWLERFRARSVRDLRDLDAAGRLSDPFPPLRMATFTFALVFALAGIAYAFGRTGGSMLGFVSGTVAVTGLAVAVGSALAAAEYRLLQEADDSRHDFLALLAQVDVLEQREEERLHDARAVIGAMGAALHALVRSGDHPEVTTALAEELDQLRTILLSSDGVPLTRVSASAVCHSVESFAKLRGISLEIEVPGDLFLLVEPTGVAQIARNLIDNARKYAPGSTVRIGCDEAGEYAKLLFDDDGPGVGSSVAHTMFDSGIRGGGPEQGAGRGLAVSRRLAESMGGSLWYEPRMQGGSRFVLKLRVAGDLDVSSEANSPPP